MKQIKQWAKNKLFNKLLVGGFTFAIILTMLLSFVPGMSTTVQAKSVSAHKVTFHSNYGGTPVDSTIERTTENDDFWGYCLSSDTLESISFDPPNETKMFGGWYPNPDGTGDRVVNFLQTTDLEADLDLYATWSDVAIRIGDTPNALRSITKGWYLSESTISNYVSDDWTWYLTRTDDSKILLTLKNYTGGPIKIYTTDPVNIVLIGTNTITTAADYSGNAIESTSPVHISGSGTLTAQSINAAAFNYAPMVESELGVTASTGTNGTSTVPYNPSDISTYHWVKIITHTYDFYADGTKTETHHTEKCTECDATRLVAHTFGSYTSNNDATTSADGTKLRSCSVCSYVETVTDPGSKKTTSTPTPDQPPKSDPTPAPNAIDKNYEDVKTSTGAVKDITGINEATAEKNPFGAIIVNSSELETLLNVISEEKTQGVNVWIKITDASTTMSAEDKEIINNKLANNKLGMYLDATLFKKIGNNEPVKVAKVNGKIKISIVVPKSLRKDGRSYSIVRIHNGVATEINGSYDNATFTFTFETDEFSSYAITYKDSASNNGQQTKSPMTGDEYNDKLWILLCLSIFGVAGCVYGNRKNRRVES